MSDLRGPLLALLDAHAESPRLVSQEVESFRRLRTFVKSTERCFERQHLAGHVTGSAWILDARDAHVVLLHHKKLGLWLQPGGHADGDPDVFRVALKEAEEETGLFDLAPIHQGIFDVDVHAIPARPAKGSRGAEPAHFHYDVRFAFRAPEGASLTLSDESHAVRWVAREDVPRFTRDASVRRMHAKWSSGLCGATN